MHWQKKIFDCYKKCEEIPIQIAFFPTLEKFHTKLRKHILASKESWGWEKVFPEIFKNYGNRGQISEDEIVLIYQEMSSSIEKSLKFIWEFPLHIHSQRKEGDREWASRTVGIAPEGFVIVCDEKSMITLYFRAASRHSGNFQCFWTARYHEYRRALRARFRDEENAMEVEQKDQKVCTEISWKQIFDNKNKFDGFYNEYKLIEGGPITQELDALLARYQGT